MVSITTLPPNTGALLPDAKQLRSLRKIVAATHPWIGGDIAEQGEAADREFANAFRAVSRFFRTTEPDERRGFISILDAANADARESVSASMFIAACLAAGDVTWRRHDGSVGQLSVLGLNEHHGLRCNNRWLAILSGTGNLLAPMPPRGEYAQRAKAAQQASFWKRNADGTLRPVERHEPLWGGRS
jgi:hypothetical protein